MLKRLVRNQFRRHAANFGGGAWLVRLRAPFDQRVFASAASTNLRRAAASELNTLMQHAKRRRERGLE